MAKSTTNPKPANPKPANLDIDKPKRKRTAMTTAQKERVRAYRELLKVERISTIEITLLNGLIEAVKLKKR